MPCSRFLVFLLVLMFLPWERGLYAWSNHALGTTISFWKSHPQLRNLKIEVESLESFLKQEGSGVQQLLRYMDRQLVTSLPDRYPPLPAELQFNPKAKNPTQSFFQALRLNPNIPVGYYVQNWNRNLRTTDYPHSQLTIYKDYKFLMDGSFFTVAIGTKISALEVLATASDEPDYGMDVGLFSDNQKDFSKLYGFGLQPFGDPQYEYSSQAPFHMGYYHESELIYQLAGFLKQTYPEVRIYQFQALAEYAFRSGHPYWGMRFMGWGLHYIQDLTQPYHTRVLPQVGTGKMIAIQGMATIGISGPKNSAITNVSNRHSEIETLHLQLVSTKLNKIEIPEPNPKSKNPSNWEPDFGKDPFLAKFQSLKHSTNYSKEDNTYSFQYPRKRIAKYSNGQSDSLDIALEQKKSDQIISILGELNEEFGEHSRVFVNQILKP